MLIYCNGDSFTAGVGVCDDIFPKYPGGFTKEELTTRSSEIRKFGNIKSSFYSKYANLQDIIDGRKLLIFHDTEIPGSVMVGGAHKLLEHRYSYPAELEKIDSSIKTINAAVAGASMGGICARTVLDLLELKEKGIKVDRVVIQLTSLGRYEIYDSNQMNLMCDRPAGFFNSPADQKIGEAVILKYTNNDHLIKFLYHLTSLKETILSITGKMPIIIDSINGEHIESNILDTRNYIKKFNNNEVDKFESLVNHSMIQTAHMMLMDRVSRTINRPYAFDGHFLSDVHVLTARELIKLL